MACSKTCFSSMALALFNCCFVLLSGGDYEQMKAERKARRAARYTGRPTLREVMLVRLLSRASPNSLGRCSDSTVLRLSSFAVEPNRVRERGLNACRPCACNG